MQKTLALAVILEFLSLAAVGQNNIPISTQTLLNGVRSVESKGAIKSVLMIRCPKNNMKGTGFVLTGGNIITTNSHVVGPCSAEDLVGISSVSTEYVKFVSMQTDTNRDLAILCAKTPLPFGLDLKGDETPKVETEVETWGYPLFYEDPAPLLSRGYVAGYTLGRDLNTGLPKDPPVRHLIVNGALNPGNSGGPLIDRATGKVIGIVVEKWFLFDPNIRAAIEGLRHSRLMTGGGLTWPDENGVQRPVTNEVAVANSLDEFYKISQVMIGEAISVSELNAFIKEKRQALACGTH